jgi:hypothetical protein
MFMNKIFCFGDGYAAGHIWPEWPNIVEALYPDLEHENFGAIGAGNEFTTSCIVQAHIKDPTAFFIIQWAPSLRFDKLLQDNSWDAIIDNDPVYHFNRVQCNNQTWWLSSASRASAIQNYHTTYVQNNQSSLRSFNFKYLVEHLLENQSLCFTLEQMSLYSKESRFKQVRQQEVQPSPIVHLNWVEEKILPFLPWQPCSIRLNKLKTRIIQHTWKPYDPDRTEIWKEMSDL